MNTPALTDAEQGCLLRRGFAPEYATLGWKAIGVVVLAITGFGARLSVAERGRCGSRGTPRSADSHPANAIEAWA